VADGAFEWDDLGAWPALARHLKQGCRGQLPPWRISSMWTRRRNIIFDARTKKPDSHCGGRVARFNSGAQTDDAVLLAHKSQAQKNQGTGQETGRGIRD